MPEEVTEEVTGIDRVLALVAYIFGIIPAAIVYYASDKRFVKIHALQAIYLNLLMLIPIFLATVGTTLSFRIGFGYTGGVLSSVVSLVTLATGVILLLVFGGLYIAGMVYAALGKPKKLPLVGRWVNL